jgi:hypothetical protein
MVNRRSNKKVAILLGIILSFAFFAYANAAFNEQINYQGKLTNTANGTVSDGQYLMKFELFTTSTGGAAIWTENRSGGNKVQITNGLFSVLLGEISSLSAVNFNQDLWLEVSIGTSSLETMTPRKHVGAVPAAFEAKRLNGQTWDAPGAIGGATPSSAAFTDLTVRPNSTSIFSIVSSSGEILFDTNNISQRFGLAVNSGAFISRNSYIDEEFNAYRTTRANAADYAGNQAASFGDNRGWGVYSSANNCTYGQVTNGVNGRMRIQANLANRGCMTMMDETANVPRQVISVNNSPVILMKAAPNSVGANNWLFAGIASSTAATMDGQTVTPTPFIGFTNNGGGTWTAIVTNGTGTTTVSCGQSISTTAFAELMIEARSATNVRFFVDNDVTDGVNFSECGSGIQTNIPTGLMAPYFTYQVRTGGTVNTYLDADFFRAWQDDDVNAGYLTISDGLIVEDVFHIDTSTRMVTVVNGSDPYNFTVSGTSTLATTTASQMSLSDVLILNPAIASATTSALYNSAGILYWNGDSITDRLLTNGGLSGQTMYWNGSAWVTTSTLTIDPVTGFVGIGTTSPLAMLDVAGSAILSGADNYLSFGDVSASSGYGIRDYAGKMQFKNNDGVWANIVAKIDNIISVAKTGGDFDNLMDAVDFANSSAEDTLIEIYPGIYNVSTTLTITGEHFKGIIGKSEEGVFLTPSDGLVSSGQPLIDISLATSSDFGLRQFSIDASATGCGTTPGCSAIRVSAEGDKWMNFYDITVRGTYRGIEMTAANMVNSTNMDFYNIGQDGVYLDNGASLQAMGDYFEDVGGYYAHVLSTSGASSFYMVGSEFGSYSDMGVGLYIAGDDSNAELRQSNMWGLEANIVANDNSEVSAIGCFLEKPLNLNIEQKDTSKITIIGGAGAFSSTDVTVNDSARVYFNTFSQTNSTTIIGNHSESDQVLFKIDEGTIDSPYLGYRGNYYGGDGMLMIDPNLGEASFLASQSQNDTAKLIGVTGNRAANALLSLYSEAGEFGSDTGSRGWDISRAGSDANLIFNFKNNDTGDGKPVVPDFSLLALDGFNSQLSMAGGAVFNTSSGNFNFQVKGASDANLLFVRGDSDRVGIGTSTPSEKLSVGGNLFVSGNATATIIYAATGTFGSLTDLNVAGTSTLNGPALLGSYLQFTTSGDNYLYFADSTGNYIKWDNSNGNFALSSGLNIAGTVSSSAAVVNGDSTSTGNVYIGGNMGIGTGVDLDTQLSINASGGKDLLKIVGSSNAGLYVHNSGKVIIGTTTILDGDMLEVVGTDLTSDPTSSKNFITMTAVGNGETGFYARRINSAYDNGWSWYMETSSLDFRLYDDSIMDDVVTFQAGGNVGIGTISPSYKLTVSGTSSLRDAMPESNVTYDLGSPSLKWRNLFVATGTFDNLVINHSNPTNLTWVNATGTNLAVTNGLAANQLSVANTSTLSGPLLIGSYIRFNSSTDNYIYFADNANKYLKWDNAAGKFYLTNSLDVNGTVTSTALAVNGTAGVNDLVVANSITLGGVSRSTWPSGGGGAAGFWVTTTANVAYPDLNNPFAVVIGSSATTSNSIFEVAGNSKLIGNLLVTGNASSTRLYSSGLAWDNATGTNFVFTTSTGTSLTIAGLSNLNGGVKVGDTSSTASGIIKFAGNDFLGYDGSYWRSLTNVASVRGEATGFPNTASSTMSFTNLTRTFTIAPVGGSFDFYFQGARFIKTTGQTTVIDDAEGVWYIYFDDAGTLQHSQSEPDDKSSVNVAQVYWDTTNKKATILGEYRSGLTMDTDTHSWIRMTVGPRYSSGLTLSGNTGGDGSADSNAEVALTGGVIYDEDLKYNIVNSASPSNPFEQDLGTGSGSSVTAPAKIPVYYRLGASGYSRKKDATSFPLYENAGGRISYNVYSSGWVTSTVPDGGYVAVWLFSTHNINEPIIAVLGQRIDSNDTDARMNNSYASLSLDSLPFQNMKVLYRLIFQTADSYSNTVKAKLVDIQDHRDVTTLPSGNYVASAHGALTGLNQDDHIQYLLSAGRNGGQTIYGGNQAGSYLILDSSNNDSKGSIFMQPVGGNVVIGSSSASMPNLSLLSLQGNSTTVSLFNIASASGSSVLRVNNNGFVGINTATPGFNLAVAGTSSLRDTVPEADITYDLGTPSLRWLNVYAASGTFANLSVTNPTHFATLTFDNAIGTNLTLSGTASTSQLQVSGTSTFAGPALLGNYLQFTSSTDYIYFNNTTTNYLQWDSNANQIALSNNLSVNGYVSSTALQINGNVTTTGGLTVLGPVNITTATISNLNISGATSTHLYVAGTSTFNGPMLANSYLQFTSTTDFIYFNNSGANYLKWDGAANQFLLSNALSVNGFVSSTGLNVNGTVSTTDLLVANAITLGGVSRTTWPSGGGGGNNFWATTTANVGYPTLPNPYAIVIGSSATSSNVIFEVVGDSKFGGNVNITGNATSSRFFATNLFWTSATGTNLSWTNANGTNITWTNATGTNISFTTATGTNLFWTSATGTNLSVGRQLSVGSTSTLGGPVRLGSYLQFTTAGDNYAYFNNNTSTFLKWDNANSRFVFSHGISASGTVSSTALVVNGNATATGNLYLGGQLISNATSTFTTTSINSLLLADGTAALPSLAFINDRGVGLFHPTGDGLGFSTSGTERMRILSNGNIGINTTTPQYKFTIANGELAVVSGTATGIFGTGAFPNNPVASTDPIGLTTNASGMYRTGLVTEVGGQLLSFAINASQLGNRSTTAIGAIFRLDTRTNTPYWSLKRQAIGGSTEYSDFQISSDGDMGIGAGHASDLNTFAGQLHIFNRTSSIIGLVVQGQNGQSQNLQEWRDYNNNALAVVDQRGNIGIGTSTTNARLSIIATSSAYFMTMASTTGVNLLEAKNLSAAFGLSVDAGAFIDRNSTLQQEFNTFRTQRTSDTTGANGGGMGDGGGWGVYENSSCTFSTISDFTNGILRLAANSSNNGCMTMVDEALTNPMSIVNVDNLPVIQMKVHPSAIGANNRLFIGAGDSTDGLTTDPNNFIGFTNNGTTWVGTTINGGSATTVTCTGQTISTAQFALVKTEAVSADKINFYVDTDVSDGINFTLCGSSTTNIPATNLAPQMHYQSRPSGGGSYLDIDYYRLWQDDSATGSSLVLDQPALDNLDFSTDIVDAAPELSIEDKLQLAVDALNVRIDSLAASTTQDILDIRAVVTGYQSVLADNVSSTAYLFNQFGVLNASAQNTQEMISGLNNRITVLENNFSSTSLSIAGLQAQISNIAVQQDSSSSSVDLLQGGYNGNISTNDLAVSGLAVFNGAVKVVGQLSLGADNAGQAKILVGATSTLVTFATPYETLPIITVTPIGVRDLRFGVSDITTSSFVIQIEPPQIVNTTFNWLAFGSAADARVFVSDGTTSSVNFMVSENALLPIILPEPVLPPLLPADDTSSGGEAGSTTVGEATPPLTPDAPAMPEPSVITVDNPPAAVAEEPAPESAPDMIVVSEQPQTIPEAAPVASEPAPSPDPAPAETGASEPTPAPASAPAE